MFGQFKESVPFLIRLAEGPTRIFLRLRQEVVEVVPSSFTHQTKQAFYENSIATCWHSHMHRQSFAVAAWRSGTSQVIVNLASIALRILVIIISKVQTEELPRERAHTQNKKTQFSRFQRMILVLVLVPAQKQKILKQLVPVACCPEDASPANQKTQNERSTQRENAVLDPNHFQAHHSN
jgi:hypothetical protein